MEFNIIVIDFYGVQLALEGSVHDLYFRKNNDGRCTLFFFCIRNIGRNYMQLSVNLT